MVTAHAEHTVRILLLMASDQESHVLEDGENLDTRVPDLTAEIGKKVLGV